MLELRISPLAEQDLVDIWFYIAQDQPINADRFLDRLYQVAQKLTETPKMGVSREKLAPGLLCFPVDSYLLYYRIQQDAVELIRVLLAARDLESLYW